MSKITLKIFGKWLLSIFVSSHNVSRLSMINITVSKARAVSVKPQDKDLWKYCLNTSCGSCSTVLPVIEYWIV